MTWKLPRRCVKLQRMHWGNTCTATWSTTFQSSLHKTHLSLRRQVYFAVPRSRSLWNARNHVARYKTLASYWLPAWELPLTEQQAVRKSLKECSMYIVIPLKCCSVITTVTGGKMRQVMVKIQECIGNYALLHEDVWWSGCKGPFILNFVTWWMWVFSFTLRPPYS